MGKSLAIHQIILRLKAKEFSAEVSGETELIGQSNS